MEELKKALWSFTHGFLAFAVVLLIGALIVKLILIPLKKHWPAQLIRKRSLKKTTSQMRTKRTE